jgi:chromosome segregation ATPase
MQPFAENTVTAIGEMRKLETPPIWIRLRPYFSHPSIVETRAITKPLVELVRGVNAYSLQVVSLNESRIPDKSKVRELVRYLRGASQLALLEEADSAEVRLTSERREQIFKDIEKRETLMDALQSADPIVNAVLARGFELSDAVDASIMKSSAAIEAEVQATYRDMLENRADLVKLQQQIVHAQVLAQRLPFGDDAAATELRRTFPSLAELLPEGKKPGRKEQQAVVEELTTQAARAKTALDQIDPQYQAYRESILELDTLRAGKVENAKLARSVLMVWARSHKSLARGVEVPPLFDLAGIISSSARGAAGTVTKGLVPF